jgi:NagD protein
MQKCAAPRARAGGSAPSGTGVALPAAAFPIDERNDPSRNPDVTQVGYLVDMDGVLYRGGQLIPGADRFIAALRERGIPFLLLTNNSQRTRRDVVRKLEHMGIEVAEEHVFTCAMATARFLAAQKPGGSAYVIGEGGLLTALHLNGYAVSETKPDYVVVGEGRVLNFEVAEKALRLIVGGAKLIATNLDPICPTDAGPRPGCGAMVALLEAAAGVKAFSVGKPSPVMMRMARKQLGLRTDEVTMVGDTMETDIVGGLQMGYRTVLVLSGNTSREQAAAYPYQPTRIVGSVADLISEIENRPRRHRPEPEPTAA